MNKKKLFASLIATTALATCLTLTAGAYDTSNEYAMMSWRRYSVTHADVDIYNLTPNSTRSASASLFGVDEDKNYTGNVGGNRIVSYGQSAWADKDDFPTNTWRVYHSGTMYSGTTQVGTPVASWGFYTYEP